MTTRPLVADDELALAPEPRQTMPSSPALSSIFIRGHQLRHEPDTHVVYQVEAHELDHALTQEIGSSCPVALPPKSRSWNPFAKATTTDEAFISERSQALERYLRTLLSHKDARWRETRAFNDFLAAPLPSTLRNAGPAAFTTSSWLDEQEALVAMARDVRADLSRRDSMTARGDVNARQISVDAKKKLATLIARMGALTKGLDSLALAGMAEGELRRRSDMVSRLQDETETLGKLAMASRNAAATGAASRAASLASSTQAEAPAPDRATLLGNAAPRPGRVLGKPAGETAQTRSLDNHGLLGLQQTMLQQQDTQVEELTAVVRRQRELALAVGAELAMHNEMLDGLSADVDRTKDRMQGADKQLKKLNS